MKWNLSFGCPWASVAESQQRKISRRRVVGGIEIRRLAVPEIQIVGPERSQLFSSTAVPATSAVPDRGAAHCAAKCDSAGTPRSPGRALAHRPALPPLPPEQPHAQNEYGAAAARSSDTAVSA